MSAFHLMPQVSSGSTQVLAHAITKGVATTRTQSAVSRVELTRGGRVGFVEVRCVHGTAHNPSFRSPINLRSKALGSNTM
jgi:hypothetical protein